LAFNAYKKGLTPDQIKADIFADHLGSLKDLRKGWDNDFWKDI